MTASAMASVIIVIVVAAGLVVWVVAVFSAERHPEPGRAGAPPRRKITGGVFRGDPRQMMPRRDAPAEVLTDDKEPGRDE